jgi:pimeloyl-ACP methyl ester carboxylesterase
VTAARSADGTTIAFETTGSGPPLVLIGGAFCDRHAKASGTPLAAHLASRFAVASYDRRGRGDSTDTPPWSLDREIDDLAAVIEAIGGRAAVYGISSGGLLAVAAASRGLPIDKLATYEAPVVRDDTRRPSRELAAELAALVTAGDRGAAAERFLTRVVGVPTPVIAGMRAQPFWRGLEAIAHTLAYDVEITAGALAIVDAATCVSVPAFVLCGTIGPPWIAEGSRELAAAMPRGEVRQLAGQTHDVDPAVLAPQLIDALG